MSTWPSTRAKRVLAALLRLGWTIKRQAGSHRVLARQGFPDFAFAFHVRPDHSLHRTRPASPRLASLGEVGERERR
jgi:predicted RNA binding protein YcfA (HicA-like mRNA interferase family)